MSGVQLSKRETYKQEGVNFAEGKNAWAKSALDSVYIKKWMRTREAIVFRLSNKITQVNFTDKSEILLDDDNDRITFVN